MILIHLYDKRYGVSYLLQESWLRRNLELNDPRLQDYNPACLVTPDKMRQQVYVCFEHFAENDLVRDQYGVAVNVRLLAAMMPPQIEIPEVEPFVTFDDVLYLFSTKCLCVQAD
uniref:Uncharacterized protein n=1 Tax=Ditylenchus dipsaci TaxID=166011 RepID=A0A915CW90_9BILA